MKRSEIYDSIKSMLRERKYTLRAERLNSAIRAIDSERDYQEYHWGGSTSDGEPGSGSRSLEEFILYINGYAEDALQVASHSDEASKKLEIVRKVAALCVACLEQGVATMSHSLYGDNLKRTGPSSIDSSIYELVKSARRLFRADDQHEIDAGISSLAVRGFLCLAAYEAPLRAPVQYLT